MNIHPIKSEQDYQNALQVIEGLMMAKANTPEGEHLDIFVTLVEDYALDFPDPIEGINL